jgi:ParB family transcriptional regulator, chromosome partitioning protein
MKEKPRSRLGRGISSLMSVSEERVAESFAEEVPRDKEMTPAVSDIAGTQEIPLDHISPNPHQPRRTFDSIALNQLAESLKSSGLIQPIILRRVGETYQLIAGERRLRAAKLAGFSTIPAIVRDVDSLTQAQMALIENVQREDLNPLDRASAYRVLIDQLGLTQAELAIRLGEERSGIANYLRLLDLAEPIQEAVREGKLSLGHAKLLAGIADLQHQQGLADLTIAQDLSVRNLERLIQNAQEPPTLSTAATPAAAPSAHIADLEKSITRQLGMRAQVRSGGKGRGRLVIHYGSLDQFDQLLSRLNVSVD